MIVFQRRCSPRQHSASRPFERRSLRGLRHLFVVACAGFSGWSCATEEPRAASIPDGFTLKSIIYDDGELYLRALNSVEKDVKECMSVNGFAYQEIDNAVYLTPAITYTSSNRMAVARQRGYGISIQVDGLSGDPNFAAAAEDRTAAENVTFQEQLGFCKVQAIKPYDDLRSSLAAAYSFEVLSKLGIDPRVDSVGDEWSTCMANSGHEYRSVDGPVRDIQDRYLQALSGPATQSASARAEALRSLQEEERELAIADAECWISVVYPITEPVEAEYDAPFLVAHADEIRALERFWT